MYFYPIVVDAPSGEPALVIVIDTEKRPEAENDIPQKLQGAIDRFIEQRDSTPLLEYEKEGETYVVSAFDGF